jgi:uroporphyrinogen-III synthase
MGGNEATALGGLRILVTRPAHQAQALCNKIEALGGRVLRLPVLAIVDPADITPAVNIINQLDCVDIAIFISSNAVEKAHALITSRGAWPAHLKIAAVGKHTAETLQQLGIHVDLLPQHQFNSEALLALDELQHVAGKHIVIFRGTGGRELLAQNLRQRGAHVQYAEVYRRIKPDTGVSELQQAGAAGKIHIITVTSNDSLQNLYDMAGNEGRGWLLNTPLAVISRRTADLAQQLGFKVTLIAKQASDQGLVDTIKEWYAINRVTGNQADQ